MSAFGGRSQLSHNQSRIAAGGERLTAEEARHRMREAEFQQMVIDLARRLGWAVYHTFDSRRSEPGFPDLVLIRGDRLLAIECKRDGEVPTPEQWTWLHAFEGVSVVSAYVARPGGDWADIERILR